MRRLLPPLAVVAALVGAWQAVCTALAVNPRIVPGPRLVVAATWDDRAGLWPAITATTEETILGLLVAIGVAVLAALAIDASRLVRHSVYPLVVASQTLPAVALAPLVVIWFGFGMTPKIVLVALFTFFPITVGLVQGLRSADDEVLDLLRTMRARRWQVVVWVKGPAALAQLFTGLKIAVTYAFATATVVEFVGATQGLGYFMTNASHDVPVATDLVFGATVVTALLTLALFAVVSAAERAAMPWRPRRVT